MILLSETALMARTIILLLVFKELVSTTEDQVTQIVQDVIPDLIHMQEK